MKSKVSCNLIKDLLPIYTDNLGSEDTNKLIKEHLDLCKDCKEEYMNMSTNIYSQEKNNDESIRKFKRGIVKGFILVILISILSISLSMMCHNIEYDLVNTDYKEIISLVLLNIGVYFIPMFALLSSWIWKKSSYGSNKYNVLNGLFIILLIINISEIISLLLRFINLANIYLGF